MVSTVAAWPSATDAANDSMVAGWISGRSPLRTTTGPSQIPVASSATRTAWAVPRRSDCSTHSTCAGVPS